MIQITLKQHSVHTRPETALLPFHQFGRYLAQILPSERRATEICTDVGHGQDHPLALLLLVCNIKLGNRVNVAVIRMPVVCKMKNSIFFLGYFSLWIQIISSKPNLLKEIYDESNRNC